MKNIITISREFGSGGRYIGEKVAQKLGIKYYDKEIITKIAAETGLAEEFVESRGEYSPSKNSLYYTFAARTNGVNNVDDMLYAAQYQLIRKLADEGPCVIVGRCADYILKDRNDVLNVFIIGNEPEKISRIEKLYNKSEKEAARLIKDTDKRRSINYQYYTDRNWGETSNYDLVLNSSTIGYDNCIKIIEFAAK